MNQAEYNRWLAGEVRQGDILLSINKKNLMSELIAEITDSQWSHSFLYLGGQRVIESTINNHADGVQINPLAHYLNDKYAVGLFRVEGMTSEHERAVVAAAKTYLGVKYSIVQIVYDFFMLKLGRRNLRAWRYNAPGMVCSELIGEAFNATGRPLRTDLAPSQLAPGDIAASPVVKRVFPPVNPSDISLTSV